MRIKFIGLMGFLLSLMSIGLTVAQGSCPQLVEQALQAMGENCEALERNTACYGYNLVSAQFAESVEDDFFTLPTDTTPLDILETIQTAEMSADLSQWGVAVMNLQANIPDSIPGQAVKFVLLGDVEVESAVEPDNVFEMSDAIDATVTQSANIRSGASLTYNVIGGVTSGDLLPIDGQSADGEWYRTVIGERIGWIFGDLLEADDEIATLPVIDGTQRSLMQSFYMRTGFGTPACEEAPQDTLMIQSPQGIEVDLTVNGADIRIGSTIMIRTLSPGDIIEFTVLDGKLTIPGARPDGSDLTVFENYRTTACLTDPDNLGSDGNSDDRLIGCDFTEPEFVPDTDLGGGFCSLAGIPANILNYSVEVPCAGDEPIIIIIDDTPADDDMPTGTDNGTSESDTTDTADDSNLCSEGNAWDDGRCTSDYWWNMGFYLGLVEEGVIVLEDVPEPYYVPPPTPTATPEPEKKKDKFCQFGFSGMWDIYNIKTESYIQTVSSDPGYPTCQFG